MRSLIVLTLLATTAAPVLAQAPPPAATPALSSTIPTILLDSLRGKNQIVGITKTNGTRYLCRIKAGDHGQYIAQEFHFAGPPRTHSETVPASTGNPVPHTKRVTVGSGRGRHTVSVTTYSPGGVIKAHKVETKTDTIIPDDQAVRFLLAGVAGSLRSPREIEGPEDMFDACGCEVSSNTLSATPAGSHCDAPRRRNSDNDRAKIRVGNGHTLAGDHSRSVRKHNRACPQACPFPPGPSARAVTHGRETRWVSV